MTTLCPVTPNSSQRFGPSYQGWALLLLIILTAAVLRFWQLGEAPPGLYRDEAYNGLDALNVLAGEHQLFFTANNGREPTFIYLTALSVSLLGRTPLAVRLPAAVVGILATWVIYHLAATWFNQRVGFLSAWLWAVTLWPLHLSRIGLRVILLPLILALLFWIGGQAYRRQDNRLWLLAGCVYGAGFYTYLAIRFTPVLLLLLLIYLLFTGRRDKLWPGLLWFSLGTAVVITPLIILAWQQPAFILSRSGQVSILNPIINEGNLWGALWRHTGQALGLFLWQGDTILRHNPAGRPVFDLFIALPFLVGLGWCLWSWRRPSAGALLIWSVIMLGPTILAEDTPHFLRTAGILPAILIFPAIGLSQLWTWTKLPSRWRQALVMILLTVSLMVTVRDYVSYSRSPDTAYLFETAARTMAEQINQEVAGTTIYIEDERLWRNWPSVQFLVNSERSLIRFKPEEGLSELQNKPVAIYVWPYEPLDFMVDALKSPLLVSVQVGALSRGDLEEQAYPLYLRYTAQDVSPGGPPIANFDNQIQLRQVETTHSGSLLQVDLYWSTETGLNEPVVVFIHVMGSDGLVAQSDNPPAQGYWPSPWWQADLIIHDQHVINLREPYDNSQQQLLVGIYNANTGLRLPILNQAGELLGDTWLIQP